MTTYGNTARISVDVSGGGIVGIEGGGAQKLVIFGRGDTNNGTASANDPTQVSGPTGADDAFGSDTPLTRAIKNAAGNGVPYDLIWGVATDVLSVTDEDITGGGDAADHTGGSKINGGDPIIEDTSRITVQDDQSNTLDVEFHYKTNTDGTNSDFTSLSPSADTIYINPNTGEWVADAADNYDIDYEHNDWGSAFDSATGVIAEQETGHWQAVTEAESVASTMASKATPLRENEWKMVRCSSIAEPNADSSEDPPDARYAPGDYTDGLDDDFLFVFAPGRLPDSVDTIAGHVAGVLGGNALNNPVLTDDLTGVTDLEQTLTVPEQETLKDAQVMPISDAGSPTIEGSGSTSTASDYVRDWFTVRLRDEMVLIARAIGKAVRGRFNNDRSEELVEEQLADEIVAKIEAGVMRPNTDDQTRWFVNADQDPNDNKELDISFGFTPVGVTDVVDVDMTVEA